MRWNIWAGAIALGLVACGSGLPPPSFQRFDPRVTPRAADHPDVAAIVLLDRGLLTFGVDPERDVPFARLRRYRRMKVLRPAGRNLGRIEVPYDPGVIVRGFIARAVQPNGDITLADSANPGDIAHASGLRAKTLDVPGIVVGTVVEHTYDLYMDDLRFLPPWRFQDRYPTVRSEYAVVVPEGFQVDLRFSNAGEFVDRPPERFEVEKNTRYSWSMANLPPRFPEPNMPQADLLSPRAHVIFRSAQIDGERQNGFESWDAVAAWHLDRVRGWDRLSDRTIAEARRVAGDSGPDERALKLLEVLARDLRDASGPDAPLWRASIAHPDQVLSARRANPTTRGMLLVALLRAAGLRAVPGLYAYRDRDVLLPDVPTVRALDGVVAVVPRASGALFLDPNQLTVNGWVPSPRLQGARVVLARDDGAEVVRVPRSRPEDSKSEIEVATQLKPNGALAGQISARLTGAEAGALRQQLLDASAEDYARITSNFLHARGAAVAVESVTIADLRALRRPLTLRGRISIPKAFGTDGSEIFVRLGKIVGWPQDRIRQTRKSPLLLGPPRIVELRGTLQLPPGYESAVVPPAADHRFKDVSVQFRARAETARRLGFVRTERWNGTTVSPREYARYYRFLLAVRASEDAAFSVRRPPERRLEY